MTTLYSPLTPASKEIRLLTIEPGSGDDPLQCSLTVVSLNGEPDPVYETISYCWGNVNATKAVVVDGLELSVPASADAALRRVRLSDTARVVWIDSICINQRDTREREQQVSIMGDVYKQGRCNLIYMGSDSALNKAVDDMKAILAEVESSPPHIREIFESTETKMTYGTRRLVTIPEDSSALQEFYSHDWFRYVSFMA